MRLENLADSDGHLTEILRQLDPATIQHAHQIMNDRGHDHSLRDVRLLTADFPVYAVEGGKPVLYLATGKNNLIFANAEDAIRQLNSTHNYQLRQGDIEAVLRDGSTLRLPLSGLNLTNGDNELS